MGALNGKVVAITGAGGGLGRAYALHFAKLGAKLVINDVGGTLDGDGSDASFAQKVVDEVTSLGAEAVAHTESIATVAGATSLVQTAVKRFGRLDGLINNAGILRDKTLLKMTEAQFDSVVEVHLKGTFACSQAAAAQFREQGDGGSIVNTTSYAGLKGNFGQTNYGAAKAGIYGMTLVHAQELSRYRIRTNAIAPMAKTRMTKSISLIPDSMTVDQVAPMVAFLLSDASSSINGRVFGVHGPHVFEYKMQTSPGLRRDDWSVETIAESLPEISKMATEKVREKAAGPASKVAAIFELMPKGFVAEKAGDWTATLHWKISGTGDFTVTIADGQCKTSTGAVGEPTCVVTTDTETFIGIVEGTKDPQQAFMQGKISATNIGDLIKYQSSIDVAKAASAKPAANFGQAEADSRSEGNHEVEAIDRFIETIPTDRVFQYLVGLLDVSNVEKYSCDFTVDGKTLGLRAEAGALHLCDRLQSADNSLVGASADLVSAWFEKATSKHGDVMQWLIAHTPGEPREVLRNALRARGLGVNWSALGRRYHGEPSVVLPTEIKVFADATNDRNPSYGTDAAAQRAPLLFPVRYFDQIFFEVFGDSDLGIDLSRLLFGEFEMRFEHALMPKMVVATKAEVVGIEDKASGQLLRIETRLVSEGKTLCAGLATFFIRWEKTSPIAAIHAAQAAAIDRQRPASFEGSRQIDDDQARRFGAAALDPNPIHLDDAFAKSVGLRAPILQGLCSLAFAAQTLVEHHAKGNSEGVESLSVRFASPAYPGQTLTTFGYQTDDPRRLRFVSTNSDGEVVLERGSATFRGDS